MNTSGFRNTAAAVVSTVAQIGAVIGPAFILLQNDIPWLPNCIFAFLSIFGGLITLCLPETNGIELTETIKEAELFYSGKVYRRYGFVWRLYAKYLSHL